MKKTYIIILAVLAIIAIGFAIPIVPIPVQRTETYTETEIKKEPYTTAEEKQVGSTYLLSGGFDWTDWGEWGEYYTYNSTDHSISKVQGQHYLNPWDMRPISAGTNATNCSVELTFRSLGEGVCSDMMLAYFIQGLAIDFAPNNTVSTDVILKKATCYQMAKCGVLKYDLSNAPSGGFWMCIRNMMPNTIYKVMLWAEYKWDEPLSADQQVTKYRDVSVQVEKQRTMTDYQKVSVWQRIFNKQVRMRGLHTWRY